VFSFVATVVVAARDKTGFGLFWVSKFKSFPNDDDFEGRGALAFSRCKQSNVSLEGTCFNGEDDDGSDNAGGVTFVLSCRRFSGKGAFVVVIMYLFVCV